MIWMTGPARMLTAFSMQAIAITVEEPEDVAAFKDYVHVESAAPEAAPAAAAPAVATPSAAAAPAPVAAATPAPSTAPGTRPRASGLLRCVSLATTNSD
jgi:hypothetical protein